MNTPNKVPTQNLFTFCCLECGREMRAPSHFQGKLGRCNYCGKRIVVPSPQDKGLPFSSRLGKSHEADSLSDFAFSAAAKEKFLASNSQRARLCAPWYRLWVYGGAGGVFLNLIALGVCLALPQAQRQTTLGAGSETFIGAAKSSTKEPQVGSERPNQAPKPIEQEGEPKSKFKPEMSPPVSPHPQGLKMANSSPQAIVPKSSPSPQQPAPPANSAVPTNVPKALNTPEVILERVKRATAFIEGKNGSSGTAFVIGRGILATNSHVIRGDYLNDIRVRFIVADNVKAESLPVKLLYEDARRDLALLAVQIPDSLEPLRLAVHEKGIPAGLPVALIGNPGRLEGAYREIHAVTEGVVEGPVVFKTMDVYYHTTAEGARGTSGGPVIDSKTGDVIGVQTIGMGESRNPLARGPGPKRVSHKGASQETLCVPSIFVRDALDEVAAAPDRDQLTEQATARHLALMVTLKICKFHENTVIAAEANKRIRQQRWGVSSRCLDVINDYSASYNRTMGELRPALRQVRNTSALRHSIKNALQEFVDNYEETKKEAVKLKVMYYKQFDDRYDGLIRKHEKLQRKLFKELEIPEHVASWLLQ